MHLGIVGLPKVGKTTLFNTLTASEADTDKFSASRKTNIAVAKVPDPRLAELRDLFKPKRYVPATVDYVDVPGISKGESKENLDLDALRQVDALVHVVRVFDDPELPHPEGSIDAARDVETLDLELVLADYEVVERRIDRLAKSAKRGLSAEEKVEEALLKNTILPTLENEQPLRSIELSPDDEKRLRGFQLLSAKPQLVILNVDESAIGKDRDFGVEETEERRVVVISAPIEAEIALLSEDEQREFLDDLGLEEPSLDRVLRASYELLGLISFFTVGEDEVRAWTIRRGTIARKAAGAIHSDIERGFIRAEVVPWDELLSQGSMAKCRDQGTLRLEGKEYLVKDGDVTHFRFNV
ncbi:MAG: redox-regulated ATPase YchF [Acidobacteriota bacterium]